MKPWVRPLIAVLFFFIGMTLAHFLGLWAILIALPLALVTGAFLAWLDYRKQRRDL